MNEYYYHELPQFPETIFYCLGDMVVAEILENYGRDETKMPIYCVFLVSEPKKWVFLNKNAAKTHLESYFKAEKPLFE